MNNFIAGTVVPLIGTFAVGAMGWVLTHFCLKPILKFHRMRERAHETIEFTANVFDRPTDPERYDRACDEIRRLAAQLRALHLSTNWAVQIYFQIHGYELEEAGSAMIGLSNTLSDKTGERAGHRWDAEKALRLPLSYKTRPKIREKAEP